MCDRLLAPDWASRGAAAAGTPWATRSRVATKASSRFFSWTHSGQHRQIGQQRKEAIELVLEQSIEELVAGNHDSSFRPEPPWMLAPGSGEALLPGNDGGRAGNSVGRRSGGVARRSYDGTAAKSRRSCGLFFQAFPPEAPKQI